MEKLSKIRWLMISLPLLCGGGIGLLACLDAFKDGLNFVRGIHSFKWIGWWFLGAVVLVLDSIIALAAIMGAMKQRPVRRLGGGPWWVFVTGIPVSIMALLMIGPSFRAGRLLAYKNIDLPLLVQNCQQPELAVSIQGLGDDRSYMVQPGEARFASLPSFVRNLKPLFVWRDGSLVVVQMDGGGVMYHEGLLVAPDMPLNQFIDVCHAQGYEVPNARLPVCMYRLYDWRQAVQAFQAASQPAQ